MTHGRWVLAPIAAVLLGAAVAPAAPAAPVTLSGSETMAPVVAELIVVYRKAERAKRRAVPEFSLTRGGTFAGVADAYRGVVTIGMAARDRSAADPPGLVFTPIARSAVCVATHSGNRLAGVTRAQLGAMAAGAITDWSQVPGATVSGPVSMWGYFDGEGAQVVFEEQLAAPGPPPFAFPALERRQTGGEIRNGVRKIEGAIGWLDLRFTTGLNVLKVDGVACSRAAVASRRYAGRRGLSLVTRGRPSGAAARFIRWARTSTVAQRIVGRTFIPVR